MKRCLSFLLVLLLIPAFALSDLPDLSGLSFDELIQLRQQIDLALWSADEWQEVVVPVGVWKVGEDIPVGKWTISVASDNPEASIYIMFCDKLDASGHEADFNGAFRYYTVIRHQDSPDDSDPASVDLDCRKGNYIIIEYGSARFTPYTGKPSLGFK